ncbi:MAG: FdhF/YdeP family oxidoreductase [Xanthobacteraceae bacterium]
MRIGPMAVGRDRTKGQPDSKVAAGWSALRELAGTMIRERSFFRSGWAFLKQNKPGGFACVSCAWTKPAKPLPMEICESGGKATAWELTRKKVPLHFFDQHSLRELETWKDHDLENLGRLTHPLKWDAAGDRYRSVSWAEAFAEIGRELRDCDPKAIVFYMCGHASLETAYMYQLLGRMVGSNNFPNSSNMCHESTSVALPQAIGVPVGTVILEDFQKTECIFFFGQNTGTNSPRFLSTLQEASRRGTPIITFNPIHEPGLERFRHPQSSQLATGASTPISSQYYQVRVGGDAAAILGICKALIATDEQAAARSEAAVLDHQFIREHTTGFEAFANCVRGISWDEIERRSGLRRHDLEVVADVYAHSNATIFCYGMGLTQHPAGVENVRLLCNLMLLRGSIGKPGAGICPVRGHSNIQGQRTVGITEKPELVPLDTLKALYDFEPPRDKGMNTAECCDAMLHGRVDAFLGLGGNFIRAVPDRAAMEAAWRRLKLTVQVATKLNRSHIVHGEKAFLLPCLGRIERDQQASGFQAVTIEDATGCIHASVGHAEPASPHLLSEPKIVAELAKVTLGSRCTVDWDGWVADYSRIRHAIASTYPEIFHDIEKHMWAPGGVHRPLQARVRRWTTPNNKANFHTPEEFFAQIEQVHGNEEFDLITLRSNDQFNTTVYGYKDRYRQVFGTRDVLLMNPADIGRLGLRDGDSVDVFGANSDGIERAVLGLRVTAYNIPEKCCAGYYPECNALIPWWHYAKESKTPAAKLVRVRVREAEKTQRHGAVSGSPPVVPELDHNRLHERLKT